MSVDISQARVNDWYKLVQEVCHLWKAKKMQLDETSRLSLSEMIRKRLIEVYGQPLCNANEIYLNCLMDCKPETTKSTFKTDTLFLDARDKQSQLITPCPQPPPPILSITPTKPLDKNTPVVHASKPHTEVGVPDVRVVAKEPFIGRPTSAFTPMQPHLGRPPNPGRWGWNDQAMVQSLLRTIPSLMEQVQAQCTTPNVSLHGYPHHSNGHSYHSKSPSVERSSSAQWKTRDEYLKRLQWLQRMYHQAISEMQQLGLEIPLSSSVENTNKQSHPAFTHESFSSVNAVDCVLLTDNNLQCKEDVDTSQIPSWARKRIIPEILRDASAPQPPTPCMMNLGGEPVTHSVIPPTFIPIIEFVKNLQSRV